MKDNEAFHEWLSTKTWVGDHAKMAKEAWQAAIEYSKQQHLNGTVLKSYEAEKTSSQKLVDDLNAYAKKALKELDARKTLKK
jgi:maltooligosyltrehalose synthase